MKVFVYWNLHKKLWSVRDQKTKKVVDHLTSLTLTDCQFKVSESGRQRVLREKRKNVHAGVIGNLSLLEGGEKFGTPVTYNPYFNSAFQHKGDDITRAWEVRFHPDKTVFAS